MNKRWLLIPCPMVLAAVGLTWLLWEEPPIGPASFHRIQIGMSQEQVEAGIGMPPLETYKESRMCELLWLFQVVSVVENKGMAFGAFVESWQDKGGTTSAWIGNDYGLLVAFDGSSNAVGVYLWKPATSQGIFDRIRGWLGV